MAEVSSVSNFETYQSNRLKLRYKDGKAKHLAHTQTDQPWHWLEWLQHY